jgi:hypothetical protein
VCFAYMQPTTISLSWEKVDEAIGYQIGYRNVSGKFILEAHLYLIIYYKKSGSFLLTLFFYKISIASLETLF